ncbi:T9SS type A sorting domain-containing protein, partial [Flavobacterium saliperosum]
ENRIIRLNPDGSKDATFTSGSGFNESVYCVVLHSGGKILLGGAFNTYKGVTENYIIRLNPDGNKDTVFDTGTGFNGFGGFGNYISSIALNPDGKIFVAGNFTTYKDSGESAYLIALHSETSLATENFTNSNGVSLYPNPVKDILNIDLVDNTRISSVKIYDLQGKLLLEKASNDIDVSSLSVGVYLIKIKSEKGEFTKKFIKE